MKLYFCDGLPTETDEDIKATIPAVAKRILDIGREIAARAPVSASCCRICAQVLHAIPVGYKFLARRPSVGSSYYCLLTTIGDSRLPTMTWNVPW